MISLFNSTKSLVSLPANIVNAFPLSLTAIPVSYDDSQVLKCSVSFNFIRYVMERKKSLVTGGDFDTAFYQARDLIVNSPQN